MWVFMCCVTAFSNTYDEEQVVIPVFDAQAQQVGRELRASIRGPKPRGHALAWQGSKYRAVLPHTMLVAAIPSWNREWVTLGIFVHIYQVIRHDHVPERKIFLLRKLERERQWTIVSDIFSHDLGMSRGPAWEAQVPSGAAHAPAPTHRRHLRLLAAALFSPTQTRTLDVVLTQRVAQH